MIYIVYKQKENPKCWGGALSAAEGKKHLEKHRIGGKWDQIRAGQAPPPAHGESLRAGTQMLLSLRTD